MNFLFQTTISERGLEYDYNVFEFKLQPGRYHAQLLTPADPSVLSEIDFWKEESQWRVRPPLMEAKRLAETIGGDIEQRYT